jgi:hypothetical protein
MARGGLQGDVRIQIELRRVQHLVFGLRDVTRSSLMSRLTSSTGIRRCFLPTPRKPPALTTTKRGPTLQTPSEGADLSEANLEVLPESPSRS